MASERFLKAQFGKQASFGTPAVAEAQFPAQGEYEDAQEEHEAPFDAGVWTPQTIVAKVSDYATFTLKGTAFFELLPVLLNAGLDVAAPVGDDPYTYTYLMDPAAVGTPAPYTWLLGGGDDIGATGPAVKIQDAYLESLTLSGNLNSKQVALECAWFGLKVDDNGGAGYTLAPVALPTNLEMLKALLGQLNLKDAGTAGGSFAAMTAVSGKMLDWSLKITTGVKARWSADGNALTYGGIYFDAPAIEFTPTIRTDSATYALVKAKQAARTYQELQLVLNGTSTRKAQFDLTGRWTACPTAHAREGGELVMKPTFVCQTPHTQTTTPHYFGCKIISKYIHGGA